MKFWNQIVQYLKRGFVLGVINFLIGIALAFILVLLSITVNPFTATNWTALAIMIAIPAYLVEWIINGWAMGWIVQNIK